MKSQRQAVTVVAASASGFAAGVTGAAFVLTNNAPSDGLGHLVTITNNTANTHVGQTLTITGLDENGNAQSETITGPAGSATVTSTEYYSYVSSVVPSASIGADTFNIGWATNARSRWFQPDLNPVLPFNIGIGVAVASGTPNFSLIYTYDNLAWFVHSVITGKTANADGVQTTPCRAMCLQFTAAGGVNATFLQPGGNS